MNETLTEKLYHILLMSLMNMRPNIHDKTSNGGRFLDLCARIQIKKGVTPKHKDQKDFKMTKSSYVQQDVEVGNVDVKEQKEMDM